MYIQIIATILYVGVYFSSYIRVIFETNVLYDRYNITNNVKIYSEPLNFLLCYPVEFE